MPKSKFKRILILVFGGLVLLIFGLIIYIRVVVPVQPPSITAHLSERSPRKEIGDGLYTLGNNWFRKSESGLYELYVEGAPFERGVANGMLTRELVQRQEVIFNGQIHRLVPSWFYLGMLRYFVGWFNRDLDESIPEEYKLEIFGVSEAASSAFDDVAPAYQRILNYHAAHDIGHALQNMSLVGCTSFATWDEKSEDSTLIVGRNFDFYVGDEFAQDKIVAFYKPAGGHPFMMVTWGGMTGVLSGMNLAGLTVTINAAKSDIPSRSAMPVSLVAREILQYASTIEEAYQIAYQRKMFVSESFLIGSAADNRAAIIEKSPDTMTLYESANDFIISTNHFQSKKLGDTPLNGEHIRTSASSYRYRRVKELLERNGRNSIEKTAAILRNRQGLQDKNIGMGNEKSINQLVAHHAVIFQPGRRLVWVSTAPWQLGKFVCYDLNKVFNLKLTSSHEVYESSLTIPPDPFLLTLRYRDFVKFSHFRFPFQLNDDLQPDSLIKWNPDSYHSYMLAGDYSYEKKDFVSASKYYEQGLNKEIATLQERAHMEKNLRRSNEKSR